MTGWIAADIEAARTVLNTVGLGPSVSATAAKLYRAWYIRPRPEPTDRETGPLVSAFRAAHAASEVFEKGWSVHQMREDLGPSALLAARGEERRVLSPIDYLPASGSLATPEPGDPVLVTARRDRFENGFWFAWTRGWSEGHMGAVVRLYWNVPRATAIRFVAAWTVAPIATWPHVMKILGDPSAYGRADAAVAYLRRTDLAAAMPAIRFLHSELKEALSPDRPALARSMGRGLALAEDPGGSESFGEHRCRIVAEAAHADPSALAAPATFAAAVAQTFTTHGIDPAAPHLSPVRAGVA